MDNTVPALKAEDYIKFLEPRPHVSIPHKWVVANFIPGIYKPGPHSYLHDNGKTVSHPVVIGINGNTGLFNSKEEAQSALDAYRARWNMSVVDVASLPDNIVHKLLEPQIIPRHIHLLGSSICRES